MRQGILNFPKQFTLGIKASENIKLPRVSSLENIIVCGMGGSGLPGDALLVIESLDVFSHKNYGLPIQANKKSLVICISYSGNTQETLSAFKKAVEKKLTVISISTGGELERLCQKHKKPFVKIPNLNIAPRLALGLQFSALLGVLFQMRLIDKTSINQIKKLEKSLKPEKLEKTAKEIANRLYLKIPIIYASNKFKLAARAWKSHLNESAKIIAISNVFPELCHNEITGFEKINKQQIDNKKLHVIILKEEKSPDLKAMAIVKEMIEKQGTKAEFFPIKGNDVFERLFYAIIAGYWVGYYLALKYNIDPNSNKPIEEFKKRMKN